MLDEQAAGAAFSKTLRRTMPAEGNNFGRFASRIQAGTTLFRSGREWAIEHPSNRQQKPMTRGQTQQH